MLADLDNNGASCILLASDRGGGPRSMWQLMVDQWIMIEDYGGIQSHPLQFTEIHVGKCEQRRLGGFLLLLFNGDWHPAHYWHLVAGRC